MSTGLLERIDEDVETQVGDDDEYDHIVCHCDLEQGWCGAEVDVTIGGPPVLSGNDCPECSELALEFVDMCPFGCSCTPDMRMLNCTGDEEDEAE